MGQAFSGRFALRFQGAGFRDLHIASRCGKFVALLKLVGAENEYLRLRCRLEVFGVRVRGLGVEKYGV